MKRNSVNLKGLSFTALAAVIGGLLLFYVWGLVNTSSVTHSDIAFAPTMEVMVEASAYILKGKVVDEGTPRNLERNIDNPQQEAKTVMPGTDYTILVEEVYRGELKAGDSIKVAVAGGSYKGVKEPLEADIEPGEVYYFFLLSSSMGHPNYFAATIPFIFKTKDGVMTPISNVTEYKRHFTDEKLNETIFVERMTKQLKSLTE